MKSVTIGIINVESGTLMFVDPCAATTFTEDVRLLAAQDNSGEIKDGKVRYTVEEIPYGTHILTQQLGHLPMASLLVTALGGDALWLVIANVEEGKDDGFDWVDSTVLRRAPAGVNFERAVRRLDPLPSPEEP